jgi:hypothetical protein
MPTPLSLTKGEVLVGKIVTRDGIVFGDGSVQTSAIESVPVVTSEVFVDYLRTDSYTPTGTREYPYKTLTTAYAKAVALTPTGDKAIRIVLMSGNTAATYENLTIDTGHIFICGENSSGTHAPILFYGTLTFNGTAGSISENHFSIIGLMLNAISGTNAIVFSGSNPQRLYLRDVWVTGNGSSHAVTMTNTGSGSVLHGNDIKFSHNGTGHYHCLNVGAGAANIDALETSGAGIPAIGVDGGTLTLTNSEIDCGGAYAIDVYAGGRATIANSTIGTTAANSSGIILRAATAVAIVGNISFSVPTSATTGRAVQGVTGSFLFYGPMYFLPDGAGTTTNSKIDTVISRAAISTTITLV